MSELYSHKLYVQFKYHLGRKYYAPQVHPEWGLNSWPPDHDRAFHVTEKPALTTQPSVTLNYILIQVQLRTQVASTPSSTREGFELMTSRSFHVTETPALSTRPSVTSNYTLVSNKPCFKLFPRELILLNHLVLPLSLFKLYPSLWSSKCGGLGEVNIKNYLVFFRGFSHPDSE